VRHFSVNGQPVFAADGRFMGFRGSATDLTEQHETEERLRQSQKMDAIGQLTGGVAHDFNNVLTVITGTIEIIQEGLADRPQFAAIAQLIDDAAARGAEITSQLLTFARRQPLEPREIDVNALVIETAKLLKPILGEHIEIVTRLADDAWSAMADPSQLSSAIVNLAVNARDAMPDGGRLTLETANRELDGVRSTGDGDVMRGAFVMIAVADTGHGIPADIRERVFEPFFTTKGVGRGTGLGLSMVYGFARQTGGTVAIESEEGQGTVMRLFLPRSEGEAATRTAPAQAPAAARGHETILVVEDDPLVQGYVIAQLGGLGYRTLVAGDGAAALALVDQGASFDLLFTDIIMPGGMNGRELADAVRLRRPGVKVLYTSGYAYQLPGLRTIWLSPRVADAVARAKPCATTTLATAPYTEPSLVFLLGTGTRRTDAKGAAEHLLRDPGCGLALVGADELSPFLAILTAAKLQPRQLDHLTGLNYSTGKRLDLFLYAASPSG